MCSCTLYRTEEPKFNRRHLLVLDPNDKLPDVLPELTPFGWHGVKAQNAKSALELLDKYAIHVVVAAVETQAEKLTILAKSISRIKSQYPKLRWLAVTEGILDQYGCALLCANFSDYFHRPLDWSRLNDVLGHAWGMAKLDGKNPAPSHTPQYLPSINGENSCLHKLRTDLEKLGPSDGTVLISGETGSGKGLCAKWLHYLSHRQNGPFVTLNCGALPPSLIQSTLFGYEKGAFTGAEKRYIGLLEQAHGGTLFLDEIADLPLELQVNLLHFLDDKQILRIGAHKAETVDCRLLFASHQDLETAVEEGRFREDLFHRINVLRLHVPSLREYLTDIMLLARSFLDAEQSRHTKLNFSEDAIYAISHYSWPGNVRELQNRIRRAAVMAETETISTQDLGLEQISDSQPKKNLPLQRHELDSEILFKAIVDNKHNISAAARQLNISRTTFYRLIKKCQIEL